MAVVVTQPRFAEFRKFAWYNTASTKKEDHMRATIKVERDTAPDAAEFGGWRVVLETDQLWLVQFRGDIAECEDAADDMRRGMNARPDGPTGSSHSNRR